MEENRQCYRPFVSHLHKKSQHKTKCILILKWTHIKCIVSSNQLQLRGNQFSSVAKLFFSKVLNNNDDEILLKRSWNCSSYLLAFLRWVSGVCLLISANNLLYLETLITSYLFTYDGWSSHLTVMSSLYKKETMELLFLNTSAEQYYI